MELRKIFGGHVLKNKENVKQRDGFTKKFIPTIGYRGTIAHRMSGYTQSGHGLAVA